MSNPSKWSFFTNHALVLICLARDPEQSLRQVSIAVAITERAVQRIVAELEQAGYLRRERVGRRNHYELVRERPLRHSLEAHRRIGELLDWLFPEDGEGFRGLDGWRVGEHGSEVK